MLRPKHQARFFHGARARFYDLKAWDGKYTGPPYTERLRSCMKRKLNENLSGDEVYNTACSLLVTLKNSGNKKVNSLPEKF